MIEQLITLGGHGKEAKFYLRLDPAKEPDGFLLVHFSRGHCFEGELAWVMIRALAEGDIAIDVGANIGFFTLLMSRLVGASGQVIACEPGPNNLPSLREHLALNKIENVSVHTRPIWSCEQPVTFYLNSDSRSSNALFDPGNFPSNELSRANPQPLQMDAISLDMLTEMVDRSKIKLVKIDTEGAEQKILEGAKKLLEIWHPPYILVELNPHGLMQSGCDAETMREYMRQYGYELFFIHEHDKIPSLLPRNTKVAYLNEWVVSNALFSTLDDVSKIWPESIGNG